MKEEKNPVKCYICGRQMYYYGDARCEPEWKIETDTEQFPVHANCVKSLRKQGKKGKWKGKSKRTLKKS